MFCPFEGKKKKVGEKQKHLCPGSKMNWSILETRYSGLVVSVLPVFYFCSVIYHWYSTGINCILDLPPTLLLSVPAWGYKLTRWRRQEVARFVSFRELLQKQAKSQVRWANIYFRFVYMEPNMNPHTNPAIYQVKNYPITSPYSKTNIWFEYYVYRHL